MREIDLDSDDGNASVPEQTFLIYGPTRTGKTTFFGGFPRPLVFADVTEAGWDSIKNLPVEDRFEEHVRPRVWGIESQADFIPALERAKALVQSGQVLSIGVDSITFYADLALNGILNRQSKYDVRSAYGELGNHLRAIRVATHMTAPIVAWLSLVRDPDDDHPIGGPMIPGAQGEKFGAGVGHIFYARKEVPLNPLLAAKTPPVFEMRTKQYGKYIAGSRLGERAHLLPDPFVGNYTQLMTALGHDVDAMRAGLVPYIQPGKPAGKMVAAKPSAPPIAVKSLKATPVISKPS